MGAATAEWCDENGCTVAKSGEPTYIVHDTATVPDITLTSGHLNVYKWRTTPCIGRCGHKVILYDVEIEEPYSSWPCHKPKATSITWTKVDWDAFNAEVERLYHQHPCHSAPILSVHDQTKAITQALKIASKTLPRGCRPDPASWITPEVHKAIDRRDHL